MKIIQLLTNIFKRRKALKLANNIEKILGSIYKDVEKNFQQYKNGAERVCATLFRQYYGTFKAITLLCKNGLALEAKTLVRSIAETCAYLLFISDEDHEERTEWYRHTIDLSQKVAVDEFNQSIPEVNERIDKTFFDNAEKEAIEYFQNKHGSDKTPKEIRAKYTLKPKDAAYKLKGDMLTVFKSIYSKFYRPAAAYSHGQAPLQQVSGKDGNFGLKSATRDIDEKVMLQTTCVLAYYSVMNLNSLLSLNREADLEIIKQNIDKLFKI